MKTVCSKSYVLHVHTYAQQHRLNRREHMNMADSDDGVVTSGLNERNPALDTDSRQILSLLLDATVDQLQQFRQHLANCDTDCETETASRTDAVEVRKQLHEHR